MGTIQSFSATSILNVKNYRHSLLLFLEDSLAKIVGTLRRMTLMKKQRPLFLPLQRLDAPWLSGFLRRFVKAK